MKKPHTNTPPKVRIVRYLRVAKKHAPIGLGLFLLAIYGFLFYRIATLTSAEPDPTAVSAGLQTIGIPKVDQNVINKMQQLEDNSVNVQTLFEGARSNPFQE